MSAQKLSYLLEISILLLIWLVLYISMGFIVSTVFCLVFWGLFERFGE